MHRGLLSFRVILRYTAENGVTGCPRQHRARTQPRSRSAAASIAPFLFSVLAPEDFLRSSPNFLCLAASKLPRDHLRFPLSSLSPPRWNPARLTSKISCRHCWLTAIVTQCAMVYISLHGTEPSASSASKLCPLSFSLMPVVVHQQCLY
jgi:hypothetical protein